MQNIIYIFMEYPIIMDLNKARWKCFELECALCITNALLPPQVYSGRSLLAEVPPAPWFVLAKVADSDPVGSGCIGRIRRSVKKKLISFFSRKILSPRSNIHKNIIFFQKCLNQNLHFRIFLKNHSEMNSTYPTARM